MWLGSVAIWERKQNKFPDCHVIVHLSLQFKPASEATAFVGIWPDSDITGISFSLVWLFWKSGYFQSSQPCKRRIRLVFTRSAFLYNVCRALALQLSLIVASYLLQLTSLNSFSAVSQFAQMLGVEDGTLSLVICILRHHYNLLFWRLSFWASSKILI